MLDQLVRRPLILACLTSCAFLASPVAADISDHAVYRDAHGMAFVMIATKDAERRFIPLTEYLLMKSQGTAPAVVVEVAAQTRQIAPSAIGAQWNVGVFR